MPRPRHAQAAQSGRIRVGIGGWTYAKWRGDFYPAALPARAELAYASRRLSAIEVNGTFYRLQTPASFARWHAETPDDFVFALKAPRFVTHRRQLAAAGEGIARFVDSGIAELQDKLGPLLWQLPETHQFDAADCAAFLAALPSRLGTRALRHVLEVRHRSFLDPVFIRLLREHGVAAVCTDSPDYPAFADTSADFVYARLMCSAAELAQGYEDQALRRWARIARQWSSGDVPADLPYIAGPSPAAAPRDAYIFFINGAKQRAPAAAMALRRALGEDLPPADTGS